MNEKIEDAKFQVAKFLEQHYTVFNPLLVHSQELAETSSNLSEEFQQLLIKAETEVASYIYLIQNLISKIDSFSLSFFFDKCTVEVPIAMFHK